jgi:hypothetical protein
MISQAWTIILSFIYMQNGCLKILVKTCLKGDNLKIQRLKSYDGGWGGGKFIDFVLLGCSLFLSFLAK